MDQQTNYQRYLKDGAESAYRLSWTAYVRPAVVVLCFWMLALSIHETNRWAGMGIFLFFLLVLVGSFIAKRAVRLYLNDHGIWISSGILPWTKGITGVQWRDVDGAGYFQGFLAWTCNSYCVRVGHRFTKSSEIVLRSVANGRKFVEEVNRRLLERQHAQPADRTGT
ncbi:hypothetical protein D3C87_303450 [compost metagenome]